MIEVLVNNHKINNSVCARKGAILVFKNNNTEITKNNVMEKSLRGADLINNIQINFIYGTGGVLYRSSFFSNDILDIVKNLPKEGFFVDDVVISALLMKNKIKMYLVSSQKNDYQKKYDTIKCGIMDVSTESQNINRLAVINYNNNCHNNIFMLNY